jgi:hypothetical protein
VFRIHVHLQNGRELLLRRRDERGGRRRRSRDRNTAQQRDVRLQLEKYVRLDVRNGLHDIVRGPIDLRGDMCFELHLDLYRHQQLQPHDRHEQCGHVRWG